MPWIRIIIITAISILAWSHYALAGRNSAIPGSRYLSIRAAGLGDAFLPLADDAASGLFYNPAALAILRDNKLEPLNMSFQMNQDYFSAFGLNPTAALKAGSFLSRIGGQYPEYAVSMFPNFTIGGISFGVLAQADVSAEADATNLHYISQYQLIPTVGTGITLAKGIIRLGYSFQWVNQVSGEQTVDKTGSPLGFNQGLNSGFAMSHNLGFGMTLPVTLLPSLNVVARNVLGARFISSALIWPSPNSSGKPETEDMSIDASFSIQPRLRGRHYINFSLVGRDLTNTSGFTLMKRLALGTEIILSDLLSFRAGYSSSYLSAGVGISTKSGEFSAAWYSEDMATSSGTRKSTRFALQFQLRFY